MYKDWSNYRRHNFEHLCPTFIEFLADLNLRGEDHGFVGDLQVAVVNESHCIDNYNFLSIIGLPGLDRRSN